MFDIVDIPAPSDSTAWVPADLDQIPPGPVLAGWLSSVDVEQLSGFDRILVLRAHHRLASHYTAQTYRDMAAVAEVLREELDSGGGEPEMAAEAEIRAALTWTRRLTESELSFALDLQQRLPQLFSHLEAGTLDVRKAKVIADGTLHLPDETAHRVVGRMLETAADLTASQIRARLQKLSIEEHPAEAKSRYDHALESRRVVMHPSVEGTAHLFAHDMDPAAVAAAMRHIARLAQAAKGKDDPRTPDQVRADVFLDLLLGNGATESLSAPSPDVPRTKDNRGAVDIRVDLETLAQLNDNPGHLAGFGPVIADIARKVAAESHDARWRYTVTDPIARRPIATGTTRRRPTAEQRRTVETLHPTCVFPGCRMPSTNSDIDHRHDWAKGGSTTVANLTPLCRHDHRIKHEAGWDYRMTEPDGARWTSRLGHTYTTALPPP